MKFLTYSLTVVLAILSGCATIGPEDGSKAPFIRSLERPSFGLTSQTAPNVFVERRTFYSEQYLTYLAMKLRCAPLWWLSAYNQYSYYLLVPDWESGAFKKDGVFFSPKRRATYNYKFSRYCEDYAVNVGSSYNGDWLWISSDSGKGELADIIYDGVRFVQEVKRVELRKGDWDEAKHTKFIDVIPSATSGSRRDRWTERVRWYDTEAESLIAIWKLEDGRRFLARSPRDMRSPVIKKVECSGEIIYLGRNDLTGQLIVVTLENNRQMRLYAVESDEVCMKRSIPVSFAGPFEVAFCNGCLYGLKITGKGLEKDPARLFLFRLDWQKMELRSVAGAWPWDK